MKKESGKFSFLKKLKPKSTDGIGKSVAKGTALGAGALLLAPAALAAGATAATAAAGTAVVGGAAALSPLAAAHYLGRRKGRKESRKYAAYDKGHTPYSNFRLDDKYVSKAEVGTKAKATKGKFFAKGKGIAAAAAVAGAGVATIGYMTGKIGRKKDKKLAYGKGYKTGYKTGVNLEHKLHTS